MKRNILILALLPLLLTSCDLFHKSDNLPTPDVPVDPDKPNPDKPDPEKPEPEKPDPEKPDPDKPDPEKPEPDKPTPDPDKPEPDKPTPDPEKPDPDKPEPGKPDEGGSEVVPEETIKDFKMTPKEKEYEDHGYSSVYRDSTFRNGFGITKCFYNQGESPYHPGKLNLYPEYKNSPNIWRIAQWSSKHDLFAPGGYELVKSNDGYTNKIIGKGKDGKPSKIVETNSKDGSFYLEANASTEYDKPRKGDEPWVHLLLEQECVDDKGKLVFIKDISSLIVDATYTITKFENHMRRWQEDKNKHAAQLCWYVSIQNRNQRSSGYGQYIWFGIPLWDNRDVNKSTNLYSAYDEGTNTLIYNLPSSEYLSSNNGLIPDVNVKARAYRDVYPVIKEAFNEAKSKGYFKETHYTDLAIGGSNFGYEIPGTYDIGTKIEDFGLYYQ